MFRLYKYLTFAFMLLPAGFISANAQAQGLTYPTTTPPPAIIPQQPQTTVPQPAPGAIAVSPNGPTSTQVVNNPDGTQSVMQTFYCPKPSDLVKSGLYWGTPTGGWRSFSESFDQQVTGFIGAQWSGVNVGKMICIYKGNVALEFPITVQNDSLAQTPSGGLWGNDLGGYRNCHSTRIADCPFVVKSSAVNMQQIYNSLDFYKGKSNMLQQNNQ